jgi:hypothetical protein
MTSATPTAGSSALGGVRARGSVLRRLSDRWSRSVAGPRRRRPPRPHLRFAAPVGPFDIWTVDDHEVRSALEESWR